MSEWSEEERDDLCDALSKYSTKRALSDEARVEIVIRAVERIYAARVCDGGRCVLKMKVREHPDFEMPDFGYVGETPPTVRTTTVTTGRTLTWRWR